MDGAELQRIKEVVANAEARKNMTTTKKKTINRRTPAAPKEQVVRPRFDQIAKRWHLDGKTATPAKVRLAIKRTSNSYGITLGGRPYVAPRIGQRVILGPRDSGTIVRLTRTEFSVEPQSRIVTDDGRIVFLFQTALRGYSIQ